MRRHSGTRRGFAAAQRRKLTWADAQEQNITLSGTTTNTDMLSGYKLDGGTTQGITIMRTHLQICVQTSGATAGSGAFLGLVIGSLNDTPSQLDASEVYLDWMLYRQCYSLGGTVGTTSAEHVYEIDLRAKRKMQELQQAYWLCLSALDVQETTVSWHARTLLALP